MDQPLPFEIPNVTVLLQPEEQVLEIPRHKVKNVKQLLKYLGIRECTALVAPLTTVHCPGVSFISSNL